MSLAAEYVFALTGDLHTRLSFQVLDDTSAKDLSKARKITGDVVEIEPELHRLNAGRLGVFAFVNRLDGNGHKKTNVTGLRALFVDSDTGPLPALALAPSFTVHSARGEHGYWLLEEGELIASFAPAQKALAAKLGTDPQVSNPNRLMRVPGFDHHKAEPFRVGLTVRSAAARYTVRDVLAAFGCVLPTPRSPRGRGALGQAGGVSYAEAALRSELDRIAAAAEGERNATVNRAAFALGQLVGGGLLEIGRVRADLWAASVLVGLDSEEAHTRDTIERGLEDGAKTPRGAPEPPPRPRAQTCANPTGPEGAGAAGLGLAPPPLTDLGNAERLIQMHGADLRYVPVWGWLVWDGCCWQRDALGAAMVLAKRTAREILGEAQREEDGARRKRIAAWALTSESRGKLEAMLDLAKTDPAAATPAKAFDSDPWLLNVPNGTVDLRTGKRRPAERCDLITRVAGGAHNPEADCPKWRAHLGLVFGGDLELTTFFQRVVGYCLTGVIRDRACLFFLHGAGRNGKSVTVRVVRALLGDYGQQVAPAVYMARREGSATTDIAALAGVRTATCSEAPEGGRGAGEIIKAFGGGEEMKARFLFHDEFSFVPVAKHLWNLNDLPKLRDDDGALWDRILAVPFAVRIADSQKRPEDLVVAELRSELTGILNWALAGCLAWQQEGLRPPASVLTATSDYRAGENPLRDFLAECCRLDAGSSEAGSTLRAAYLAWATKARKAAVGPKKFTNRLTALGLSSERVGNKNRYVWHGIALLGEGESSSPDGATDATEPTLFPVLSTTTTATCRVPENGPDPSHPSHDDDPDDELL